jgi:tyrosyl-tRNA synthetase
MIGDPSGKSDERNLLDEATLNHNELKSIVALRFQSEVNAPVLVNNYDWMKGLSFINFARDVGKRIVNVYDDAKDSVKKRAGEGENVFTEFTYQLIQDTIFITTSRTIVRQQRGSKGTTTAVNECGEEAKAYAMTVR